MRDYLDGVTKVKRIMTKTTYVCNACGASHEHRNAANGCCAKKKQLANLQKEESNEQV